MNKFKIGDRVAVYGHVADAGKYRGYIRGYKAVVTCTIASDEIVIKFDGDGSEVEIHPKQCRKLKVKKLRHVWVRFNPNNKEEVSWCDNAPYDDGVEFVEVRKKK